MAYEFCTKRRVEFAETDMAGIVHFANFFRYMEMTEHEFLRSLGLSVHDASADGLVSWPRVHAECSYDAPLKFEDMMEIRLLVRQKRRKTITYDFRFRKAGVAETVARGSLTVVCVAIDKSTGRMASIAIPPSIDRLIDPAPAEMLDPLTEN